MRIDLTEILNHEGREEHFSVPLEMKSFRTRLGDFPIVEAAPVELSVVHTGNQIVEISASCDVVIEIPCARCLEMVRTPFHLQSDLKADMKLSDEELEDSLEAGGCIKEKKLDADALMHNEILSDWPMQVLCSDDCKGICPVCGCNRNQTSCNCDTAVRDPRMAAISDIFSKFKEV